jgi:hypothetical protein
MPRLIDLLDEAVPVKLTYRGREYNLETYPERATRQMRADSAEKESAERGAGDVHTLTTLVKSWDLTDENDQPLPITSDTINRMGEGFKIAIVTAIMQESVNPTQAANAAS